MLISDHLLSHESNGAVAEDGALVQVRSCETLVILITSTGELLLYFTVIFFSFIKKNDFIFLKIIRIKILVFKNCFFLNCLFLFLLFYIYIYI